MPFDSFFFLTFVPLSVFSFSFPYSFVCVPQVSFGVWHCLLQLLSSGPRSSGCAYSSKVCLSFFCSLSFSPWRRVFLSSRSCHIGFWHHHSSFPYSVFRAVVLVVAGSTRRFERLPSLLLSWEFVLRSSNFECMSRPWSWLYPCINLITSARALRRFLPELSLVGPVIKQKGMLTFC